MKKSSLITIFLFSFLLLNAQNALEEENLPEIILPPITTIIEREESEVEQKKVYTQEEIEQYHASSLTDFLQATGMQILCYGSYGLEQKPSIRGFTDETVRVVIDGVCMNNAQYGTFDFSTINIDDIEKIEIVKGGFTEGVSDEGAVGGVIYITTKKYSYKPEFDSDTQLKTFFVKTQPVDFVSQSFGISSPVGAKKDTFIKESLKASYAANKYLYTQKLNNFNPNVRYFDFVPENSKRVVRENSQVGDVQNSFKVSQYFGSGNCFSAGDIFYFGHKHVPNVEFSTDNGIQKDLNNALTLSLYNPEVLGKVKMQNSLSWIFDHRNYDAPSEHSIHKINTVRYAFFVSSNEEEKYNQNASVTLDFTHLNSTNDGKHYQFTGTIKETSQFEFNDTFSMSVPLAIKFCNKNFAFIPKAGIKFTTEKLDFFLNAYRMVQFPTMDDLYWEAGDFYGNPDLKPEDGWGGEFIINGHDIWLPFSVCIYTNYYKNKIQWTTVKLPGKSTATWMTQNVASAFYLGADVEFEKHFFDDKFLIRGNLEYLYTRLLDKSNTLTYGNKIMWTPDLTASLYMSYDLEKAGIKKITLDASYTGKRYKTNMNLAYLYPYCLVNAGVQFQDIKRVSPYLRIENLLNTSYQSVEDYPMPGISVLIGARIKKL